MKNHSETFQEIAESIQKEFAKAALSLSKSYKGTSAEQLEKAMHFAYQLYFNRHDAEALRICELMAREKFIGNFNYWTWIEAALSLAAWIYRKDGDISNYEIVLQRLNEPQHYDYGDPLKNNVNKRVRARNLLDKTLYSLEIDKAISDGDQAAEIFYRTLQIIKLLYIFHMGGSEAWSMEQLEADINTNEFIIKNYLGTA